MVTRSCNMKEPGWRHMALIADEACLLHDAGAEVPERPARLQTLLQVAESLPQLTRLPGRAANPRELLGVHEPHYIDMVRHDCDFLCDKLRTGDTYICEYSYEAALHAAGSSLLALDLLLEGSYRSLFVAARPPGHHACSNRGMGFCIFNNAAIVAQAALQRGLQRVAIVDFDVHHGNGSEQIFAESSQVLVINTYEKNAYPHTAVESFAGLGAGLGYNLNIPLPSGSSGRHMLELWPQRIGRVLEDFAPQLIVASSGFDAHLLDSMGGLEWCDETYRQIGKLLAQHSRFEGQVNLLSVLEGGYDLPSLASASRHYLQGIAEVLDD